MDRKLSLDEQETTFTIEATDRETVHVYSGDLVFQGRLERIGAEPYLECEDGGKFYKIHIDQLLLRKGKREVSEEQREAFKQRMEMIRNAEATGNETSQELD